MQMNGITDRTNRRVDDFWCPKTGSKDEDANTEYCYLNATTENQIFQKFKSFTKRTYM